MESSAIERYNPPKHNKRVFPGSSSAYMEPEVIEISNPSANQTSKSKAKELKRKEVAYHEIIDVDMYEDRDDDDVVFIKENVQSNKKMKGAMGISVGPSNGQQGSTHRGQTRKKVDSNNKGKDVSKSFVAESFFGLDDYDYALEDNYFMALQLQSQFDNMDIPTGIEAQIPWFPDNFQVKRNSSVEGSSSTYSANNSSKKHTFSQKVQQQNVPSSYKNKHVAPPMKVAMNKGHTIEVDMSFSMNPIGDMLMDPVFSGNGSSSSMKKAVDNEDVLKSFKKFDTVVDFSDHHYAKQSSVMKQPPKNWAKKIQDEWRILENDLPDTIFVRAYESRMDLLRAVIIGAEGTPYHDGLFFFDICFTSNYPNSPPLVYYHSGGLRINPNLYNTGYVCLSLLNTWSGGKKEMWVPGTSTMLQVLVSIQGLILNTKPYFNEPGYASRSGSVNGEKNSIRYNEDTLISSLKTMVYTMKKPPKNFEELVTGYFRNRVRDILKACKAYTKGVQVGSLVRGGVPNVKDSCSDKFKRDVAVYVKTLVAAFKNIGAKEAEEFI